MNKKLTTTLLAFFLMFAGMQLSFASGANSPVEQEIKELSKKKWLLMAEGNLEALDELFHEKAYFIHMGATFSKKQELDVIRNKEIIYQKADIKEVVVSVIGNTAILLNRIQMTSLVGGHDAINPFVVTEVYVKENGKWQLGSMAFTRQRIEYKLEEQ
jgi:translation elongation factor EF-4